MTEALIETLERQNCPQNKVWRPSIKVSPDPREGLLSVLLRVAEENLMFDGGTLIDLLGIHRLLNMDPDLRWRLRMNYDEYCSFTISYSLRQRQSYYKGRSFHGHPFCIGRPRYCPHCLAHTGLLLAHWDIYLTTACDIHHCFLIDKCQRCLRSGKIKNRRGLTHCCCGFDLRNAVTKPADPANIKVSTLVAISFGTLLNAPRCGINPNLPPITDMIDFDDLLMTMEGLMSAWPCVGRRVDESAVKISWALRVLEPMICLPKPEQIAWRRLAA